MTLLEFCQQLKPEDWSKKVNDQWEVKDVIAHLVGWEREVVITLEEAVKSGRPAWFMQQDNWDEFNRKSVAQYKGLSPVELLVEWQKWQNELERKIKSFGEEKLRADKNLQYLFDEGEHGHYAHHWRQIRRAL